MALRLIGSGPELGGKDQCDGTDGHQCKYTGKGPLHIPKDNRLKRHVAIDYSVHNVRERADFRNGERHFVARMQRKIVAGNDASTGHEVAAVGE